MRTRPPVSAFYMASIRCLVLPNGRNSTNARARARTTQHRSRLFLSLVHRHFFPYLYDQDQPGNILYVFMPSFGVPICIYRNSISAAFYVFMCVRCAHFVVLARFVFVCSSVCSSALALDGQMRRTCLCDARHSSCKLFFFERCVAGVSRCRRWLLRVAHIGFPLLTLMWSDPHITCVFFGYKLTENVPFGGKAIYCPHQTKNIHQLCRFQVESFRAYQPRIGGNGRCMERKSWREPWLQMSDELTKNCIEIAENCTKMERKICYPHFYWNQRTNCSVIARFIIFIWKFWKNCSTFC